MAVHRGSSADACFVYGFRAQMRFKETDFFSLPFPTKLFSTKVNVEDFNCNYQLQ